MSPISPHSDFSLTAANSKCRDFSLDFLGQSITELNLNSLVVYVQPLKTVVFIESHLTVPNSLYTRYSALIRCIWSELTESNRRLLLSKCSLGYLWTILSFLSQCSFIELYPDKWVLPLSFLWKWEICGKLVEPFQTHRHPSVQTSVSLECQTKVKVHISPELDI